MSINRLLGLTALLFTLMLTLSPAARAANCWNGSPAGLSFGTVTPGQSSATSTKLPFTCNNYDGHTEFVRACLKLMANDPIPMSQNEPSTTPLYFSLYSLYDLHHPLSQNSDVYAQIDLELASGQANVEHDIPLIGKINAGQNNVSAGNYYDYATSVQISYASASSMQSLPSCSGLSGTTVTDQISATATVKNGCEILNVDDMDFGHRSPVQSSQLEANATANITIQCPTGTSYAVSIGEGLHPDGNARQLCSNGDCLRYDLYQDADHTAQWTSETPQKQYADSGQPQQMVVYGKVPPQQWPEAGTYTDTVVITLSY